MTQSGTNTILASIPQNVVGGLPVARLDRRETANLVIDLVKAHETGTKPVIMTSANGEVISRCASNREVDSLFRASDVISADGQPMVLLSRLLSRQPVTERVATTDLIHDVASHERASGIRFYMYGATEEENSLATARIAELYPHVEIVGRSHGYHQGPAFEAKIDEINELAPDILWLAMGVPREQMFCRDHADRLTNVAVIKTSGGLFNFLSGTRARAPQWMQSCGLEWLFRMIQEPRRLFWRYAVTNPHALWLMLSKTA